jgi:hypothetical protein
LSQLLSSVPWNYLELAALLLSPLLPLTVVGAVGMVVGSLTTYLFRRSPAAPQSGPLKWRFSLRELMVTIAVFGFVLGWNMEWIRRRQDVRQANQLAFLERFKTSFTSGEVQLLRDPELEGAHRSATSESGYRVFHTPGISEYRITAPIREAGKDKWALWSYTCGPDNSMGGEHVFQFGYAEAARKSQVPAMPLPLKRYVQYSPRMIDGFPSTAGPAATVISSPASLAVDQPLVIKASAPAGTTCRLVLLPADAAATPLVDQKPDAKRAVEWSVMIQPGYAGGSIRVEVECIEARGKHSFKNSTPAPNVRLLPATQLK